MIERRARLLLAALMLLVPFAAAGCGGSEPDARPTAVVTPSRPEPEPLTLQIAQREYRKFLTNDDVARAAGDERLALAWVSDGEAALTAVEYRRAAFDGDPVKRYDYGTPKLYVPKLEEDVYPQWFVASVPRSEKGEPDTERTVLMAFILRAPGERWTLSLRTVLAPKAKEPEVVLDAGGYAEPLTTADTSVLIRPREVPGIQATVASEGGDSVAARVMKSGPVTTGYYDKARRDKRRAREDGLALTTVITATPFPIFQLRTEDGGGLVLYSLYRTTVTKVAETEGARTGRGREGSEDAEGREGAGGTPEGGEETAGPPIPPEVEHLLDGTVEGNEIQVSETLQFAAYDPPRPKEGEDEDGGGERPGGGRAAAPPKAEVIADAGGIHKAATPPAKDGD